jgi:(4S)-4-hydroxy-5-phosphonooxypentane-2,3-dione isomerase
VTYDQEEQHMAYVVAAKWVAKPDEIDEVARCVALLTPLSRAEPGMIQYQPHRDPEDPTVFYIYEQYVDEAAYTAHTDSEEFKRWGFGEAIPRLLERKREFYETI